MVSEMVFVGEVSNISDLGLCVSHLLFANDAVFLFYLLKKIM